MAESFADNQMVASLDENRYNENSLVQLKLPLNIPYVTDWKDYERCDGNIVLNGIHYNYVKRIVQNDTMFIYCVPNHQKTELNNTKTEYAKQSADLPSNKKSEQSTVKQTNVLSEYNACILQYNFSALDNFLNKFSFFNDANTSTGFNIIPAQPPELIG